MEGNLWDDLVSLILWSTFFLAVCAVLWGLAHWAIRSYDHWVSREDEIHQGEYACLSDSPRNPSTSERFPFIYRGSANLTGSSPPTPSISLIMPSHSSDMQQLYIALQARRETDAAEKQAREAARERAALGSVKSLKVPVRLITPPSRRA